MSAVDPFQGCGEPLGIASAPDLLCNAFHLCEKCEEAIEAWEGYEASWFEEATDEEI